jgi:hypothetical protein
LPQQRVHDEPAKRQGKGETRKPLHIGRHW